MAAQEQLKTIEPTAEEPQRTLRSLIGNDVKMDDVFSPAKIAESQKVLDNARDVFFERAAEELPQLEALMKKHDETTIDHEAAFEQIGIRAGNLRGVAEMFGYKLVAAICGHIAGCSEFKGHTVEMRIRLCGDLIRLLGIAIRERVADENDKLGRELRNSLSMY